MNIFEEYRSKIIDILDSIGIKNYDAVTVEQPKDASHGCMSTNAAMVCAKEYKSPPRDLAAIIIQKLEDEFVDGAEIAGPGFINLRLKKEIWLESLKSIFNEGKAFGKTNFGSSKKINLEYVSANPTGPMHIGHARGAVYGNALASLLRKTGYDLDTEYYINDAGSQIDTLAKSAYIRYLQSKGQDHEIPEGLYPGEYLIEIGKSLQQFGDIKEDDSRIKPFVISQMLDLIKQDLSMLSIKHDIFTSEKEIQDNGLIEQAIEVLKGKGLIYRGVLEKPKGNCEEWEEREQLLFKSTEFGDDVDRALQKSDGSWTYFAADVAYHYDKIKRGYDELVLVLGADHGGYVKRLNAAVLALSDNKVKLTIKLCKMVNFLVDNKPLKMSKRSGNFKTVKDVVETVGADIVSFIMLTRKNDAELDFDLVKVKEESKDNPIFYIQYANARINSILKKAKLENKHEEFTDKTLELLESDEIEIIKYLSSWPRLLDSAAKSFEPHRIAFYLVDLASMFHSLWGKSEPEPYRFITGNDELTAARLFFIRSIQMVIESALDMFNIIPKEDM